MYVCSVVCLYVHYIGVYIVVVYTMCMYVYYVCILCMCMYAMCVCVLCAHSVHACMHVCVCVYECASRSCASLPCPCACLAVIEEGVMPWPLVYSCLMVQNKVRSYYLFLGLFNTYCLLRLH